MSFSNSSESECDKQSITIGLSFLESIGSSSGKVSEGLPWVHKSFKERVHKLEATCKKFEKLPWPSDPPEKLASEMIRQYSFIRATIERVTQDLLLNGTVQRFRDYIEVSRLRLVVGLVKWEITETLRLTKRCHDIVEALESNAGLTKRLKSVRKALGFLESNPHHPGRNTHKFSSLKGPGGEEVFEAYAESKTPATWRIFWSYGPDKRQITILAITAHP